MTTQTALNTAAAGSATVIDGQGNKVQAPSQANLTLSADDTLEAMQEALRGADVIAIRFDTLTDGRGYSQAVQLRETYRFTGELRAVGDVGVDQLHYLLRAGFDSFELRPRTSLDAARDALRRFSHHYVGVVTSPQSDFIR